MGAEESTLCEKLEGPDFLPDAKLQDLLQDVLPLDLLHDTHPLQLSVSQPHQSPPWAKEKKKKKTRPEVTGQSGKPVGIEHAQLETL